MDNLNILAIFFSLSICALARNSQVFETEFCNVTCPGEKKHTMCNQTKTIPCRNFHAMIFEKDGDTHTLMELVVLGHNGLRDRVADLMNVTNMLELTWDEKLADMALHFLQDCPQVHDDTCALFDDTVDEEVTFDKFYKLEFSYAQIVQNTFSQPGSFYPYKFIERAMRAWYYEKEGMIRPIVLAEGEYDYGRLNGENNFTHLVNPLSFRFGCAIGTYHGHFHLVCNYYPYFRTSSNNVLFLSGRAVSKCPASFPLRDHKFEHLCTDDAEGFVNDANDENAANSLHDANVFVILFFFMSSFLYFKNNG